MANDKMLEFAEAEVRRLRAELEKTPAYKRLKAAENLIAEYRGNPEVETARNTAPAADPNASTIMKDTASAMSAETKRLVASVVEPILEAHRTKTAQVEAAAAEYLIQKGRRATSGELLPAVQAKGIHVTGKTPSKTISSYLSTSKRFDNVPAFGGYGLVEWNGRRTAPNVAMAENPPGPGESPASEFKGRPLQLRATAFQNESDPGEWLLRGPYLAVGDR